MLRHSDLHLDNVKRSCIALCMRRSSNKPKRPKDPNQLAADIVRLSTETEDSYVTKSKRSAISKYLANVGREGELKGGKARAKKPSAKKRKQIAKKPARSRRSGTHRS
jgi:hypothetical protein